MYSIVDVKMSLLYIKLYTVLLGCSKALTLIREECPIVVGCKIEYDLKL